MKRGRAKIDAYSIENANARQKSIINFYRRKLRYVDDDPQRAKRIESALCSMCYYEQSRIGSAVCTQTQCAFCDETLYSGNACVDIMCVSCAKRAGLCRYCGCDLDLKNRRKRDLPTPTVNSEVRSV